MITSLIIDNKEKNFEPFANANEVIAFVEENYANKNENIIVCNDSKSSITSIEILNDDCSTKHFITFLNPEIEIDIECDDEEDYCNSLPIYSY